MNEINIKNWMESAAYEKQKDIIRREINSYPMIIDYSVFKKTPAERALLQTMKENWKNYRIAI